MVASPREERPRLSDRCQRRVGQGYAEEAWGWDTGEVGSARAGEGPMTLVRSWLSFKEHWEVYLRV